jgi:hypothetical protein
VYIAAISAMVYSSTICSKEQQMDPHSNTTTSCYSLRNIMFKHHKGGSGEENLAMWVWPLYLFNASLWNGMQLKIRHPRIHVYTVYVHRTCPNTYQKHSPFVCHTVSNQFTYCVRHVWWPQDVTGGYCVLSINLALIHIRYDRIAAKQIN